MTIRNFVQPHKVKRPCFHCGQPTPALVNGVLQLRPVCNRCKHTFQAQFDQARKQGRR